MEEKIKELVDHLKEGIVVFEYEKKRWFYESCKRNS